MKCPNCGSDNKEGYRFCSKCGTKLEEIIQKSEDDFNAEMLRISESVSTFDGGKESADDFENEETVILDDNKEYVVFENEETVILDESDNGIDDFENEETVIIDEGKVYEDFENEETVILDGSINTTPAAPTFDYRTVYKEYRTDYEDTAYIDHLRRLKELLDDGIITEDEFKRKKEQILGLE